MGWNKPFVVFAARIHGEVGGLSTDAPCTHYAISWGLGAACKIKKRGRDVCGTCGGSMVMVDDEQYSQRQYLRCFSVNRLYSHQAKAGS